MINTDRYELPKGVETAEQLVAWCIQHGATATENGCKIEVMAGHYPSLVKHGMHFSQNSDKRRLSTNRDAGISGFGGGVRNGEAKDAWECFQSDFQRFLDQQPAT